MIERAQLWGFEGTDLPGVIVDRARAGRLGGITLFPHTNIESADQVRALIDELRVESGPVTPLVALDQEGGQQLALAGSTRFAGNLALGAVNDHELTRSSARAMGEELAAVGVSVDYAPVADVMSQADNPSMGVRSFGSNPESVAGHVGAFVSGLRDSSVLAVAKHFPGKGEAIVDPHHGLPVLDVDDERLHSVEMVPFRTAIEAGVDAVMMGHYAVPNLTGREDLPSSVSPRIVTGLLREELGFEGLIVTDALDMLALAQGAGSLLESVAALRAGVDLLLSSADLERSEALAVGLELAEARGFLESGAVERSLSRIDEAARRSALTDRPDLSIVGCAAHADLASEVARRSITLVRDHGRLLPIDRNAKITSVMVKPLDLTPADTSSYESAGLADSLSRVFSRVEECVVHHSPIPGEMEFAVESAKRSDVAVIGTISATAGQVELVRQIAAHVPVVTAALRTPFDLVEYPEVGTHLCTYSVLRPSLDALANVLAGEPAPGTLPVAIGTLHQVGEGITE